MCQKVYALIPAREGSKGVPKKCFKMLAGKPLISYSIQAALNASCVDKVYFSSDSKELLALASQLGAIAINRPAKWATDTSSMNEVISHFISSQSLSSQSIILLLQPTSPLRHSRHINEAISKMYQEEARGVFSVIGPTEKPFKALVKDEDGYLKGIINNQYPFMRRQDISGAYFSNGAIYAFRVEDFRSKGKIPMQKIIPYLMSEEESTDIDTIQDFSRAEKLLEEVKSHA